MGKLIDRKELRVKHPALFAKPYRMDWLIRSRKIPTVKIGRLIYFDEAEVEKWIAKHLVPVQGGADNGG